MSLIVSIMNPIIAQSANNSSMAVLNKLQTQYSPENPAVNDSYYHSTVMSQITERLRSFPDVLQLLQLGEQSCCLLIDQINKQRLI